MENEEDFFFVDTEDVEEIEFEVVRFIDLIRMVKRTWQDGYILDIDPMIIKKAVPHAPAKIVSKSIAPIQKGKPSVYRLWCAVTVEGSDYDVNIPVTVYVEDYNEYAFKWKIFEPANMVNLDKYIEIVESIEEQGWLELLD